MIKRRILLKIIIQKIHKSILDQQQIFIFYQKDNRNHKKFQANTSKLRDNIQQTPRTTFDDIEKRNPK